MVEKTFPGGIIVPDPRTIPSVVLSVEGRQYLEPLARSHTAPHRQVVRA